jgi:hypothetical protein
MEINHTFFKLRLTTELLKTTNQIRSSLLDELISLGGLDPVIRSRRYQMLQHLNQYEQQALQKIEQIKTDDVTDYFENVFLTGAEVVTNRDA